MKDFHNALNKIIDKLKEILTEKRTYFLWIKKRSKKEKTSY